MDAHPTDFGLLSSLQVPFVRFVLHLCVRCDLLSCLGNSPGVCFFFLITFTTATSDGNSGVTKYRVVQYNECSVINGATHPPCRLDRYPYTAAQKTYTENLLISNPNLTAQGLVNQLQQHNSEWEIDVNQVLCSHFATV